MKIFSKALILSIFLAFGTIVFAGSAMAASVSISASGDICWYVSGPVSGGGCGSYSTAVPAGTYSISITSYPSGYSCSGTGSGYAGDIGTTLTCTAPPPPPPPPAAPSVNSFYLSPSTITAGQSATLYWSSSNATSCTSPQLGSAGPSGSTTVAPGSTTQYSIYCSGAGGNSGYNYATLTVNPVPQPSGSILVNSSSNPGSVANGSYVTVSWSSSNASSCSIYTNGAYSGWSGTSGSVPNYGPLTQAGTYTAVLNCNGVNVSSVTLTVNPPPSATVDLTMAVMDGQGNYSNGPMYVPYGSYMAGTWTTSNVSGCEGYINETSFTGDHSDGAYNGSVYNLGPITGPTDFTLQCTSSYNGALVRDDVWVYPSGGTITVNSSISTSWTLGGAASYSGSGTTQSYSNAPYGSYTITPAAISGYTYTIAPCASQNLATSPSCN